MLTARYDLRHRARRWGQSALRAGLLMAISQGALAADVSILAAQLTAEGNGRWSASVTLEHADAGWDHYADAWRVVSKDGVVFGTRTLFHPHDNEQPFTRSLSAIAIPASETEVYIEAHDKAHGWAQQRLRLDLTKARNGSVQAKP